MSVLEELGLSMAAAARAMNYQTSATLHSIRAGKVLPDVARLSEFAKLYSVNLHWLITGEGDRFALSRDSLSMIKTKKDVDIINIALRLDNPSKDALLVLLERQ